jgi:hypothetical protein
LGLGGVNTAKRGEMEKPSRSELVERAERAIATTKILIKQFAWAIDQSIRSIDDSRRVRIGRKLDDAAFAKIGRIVAPVSEPDFDGFDTNIAEAERVLRLAREGGFSDLVEMIRKDIAATTRAGHYDIAREHRRRDARLGRSTSQAAAANAWSGRGWVT